MLSMPLYAAINVQDQDMDMGTHDYIIDKQPSFNFSMVQMSDDELSDVTAAGFSSFTIDDSVAKAYFNIQASTFTEIDSLKMGYYTRGASLGWDEDWTNVSLGSSTQDLTCNGLYIEANFSNLSDPALRSLDSIKVGTDHMTGPITATFNSFTGRIENDGVLVLDAVRQDLGTQRIDSMDSKFYMQLSAGGAQPGWYVYWSKATITPVP